MSDFDELKSHHRVWFTDIANRIKKIPDEAERLRLLIEVEKVSLLSEIAQGISLYHECQ